MRRSNDPAGLSAGDVVEVILYDVLTLLISVITGVSLTVGALIWGSKDDQIGAKIDVSNAVFAAVSLYLVASSLGRAWTTSKILRKVEHQTKQIGYRNNNRDIDHELINKVFKMMRMEDLIRSVGLASVNSIVESIKIIEDGRGWSFPSQSLALDAYVSLWEQLAITQEDENQRLIARMTHSTPLETIDSERSVRIRNCQTEFATKGGKSFRVLIHTPGNTVDSIASYITTMDIIRGYGVFSVFMDGQILANIPSEIRENDIIIVSGKNYVADWHIKENRIQIFRAMQSERQYNTYKIHWEVLLSKIRVFQYERLQISSEQLTSLQAHREAFFKEIHGY